MALSLHNGSTAEIEGVFKTHTITSDGVRNPAYSIQTNGGKPGDQMSISGARFLGTDPDIVAELHHRVPGVTGSSKVPHYEDVSISGGKISFTHWLSRRRSGNGFVICQNIELHHYLHGALYDVFKLGAICGPDGLVDFPTVFVGPLTPSRETPSRILFPGDSLGYWGVFFEKGSNKRIVLADNVGGGGSPRHVRSYPMPGGSRYTRFVIPPLPPNRPHGIFRPGIAFYGEHQFHGDTVGFSGPLMGIAQEIRPGTGGNDCLANITFPEDNGAGVPVNAGLVGNFSGEILSYDGVPRDVFWNVNSLAAGLGSPVTIDFGALGLAGQTVNVTASAPGCTPHSISVFVDAPPPPPPPPPEPCTLAISGSIEPGASIDPDSTIFFTLSLEGGGSSPGPFEWSLANSSVGSTGSSFSIPAAFLQMMPGSNTVTVRDLSGTCAPASFSFSVNPPVCSVSITSPSGDVITDPNLTVSASVTANFPMIPDWTLRVGSAVSTGPSLPVDLRQLGGVGAHQLLATVVASSGNTAPAISCQASKTVYYVGSGPLDQPDLSTTGQPDAGSTDGGGLDEIPVPGTSGTDSSGGSGPRIDEAPATCRAPAIETPDATRNMVMGGYTRSPVHLPTGRKRYFEVDLGCHAPGFDLLVQRAYDSGRAAEASTLLGPGWRFTFERSVTLVGSGLLVTDGTGTLLYYPGDGGGGFLPNPFSGATPTRATTETVEIRHPNGRVRAYDLASGKLRESRDRNGNTFSFEYDGAGTIESITDAAEGRVEFESELAGRVTALVLSDGSRWAYEYDAQRRLVAIRNPLGDAIDYEYDASHRVAARIGWDGERTSVEYDPSGRVARQVNEVGGATVFQYDPGNRTTSFTDPTGATVAVTYDASGNPIRVTRADGTTVEMDRDPQGRLLAATNEGGRRWEYTYAGSRLAEVRLPDGTTRTIQRDPSTGEPTSKTFEDGSQRVAAYDANRNLTSLTDESGGVTAFTYDTRGDLLTRTAPDGRTTSHTYDARGRRVTTTGPDGRITAFEYDDQGRRTKTTDPLGRATAVEYLLHHKVSKTIDPAGNVRRTEFDAAFRPVRTIDVDGAVTETAYVSVNGLVLVSHTIDPLGHARRFEYDALGRRVASIGPRGERSEVTYDSRGRVIATRDPLGAVSRTRYNPDGSIDRTIDPLGHETRFEYDEGGRLVRTTDPLGNVTETEYDLRGRVSRTIAADGATTTFEYDPAGRVVRTTDALGGVSRSEYDPAGRLRKTIDARGAETSFVYDAAGRQIEVHDALRGISRSVYDAGGQLVASIDPVGRETRFEYDVLGRQVRRIGPGGEVTSTAYNPDGTVREVTDPNGHTTRNSYDALDRLVAVTDPLGNTVEYEYDASGNRTAVRDENGNVTRFEYDLANRLTAVIDAAGGRVSHEYDLAGRRVRTTNARGQVQEFSYDALGRLIGKTGCVESEDFAYDAVGRRTFARNSTVTELYAYDGLGRLTSHVATPGFQVDHEYDATGNAVRSRDGQGQEVERTFDLLGRLVTVTDPRGRIFERVYNPAGQVLSESSPAGVATVWDYDSSGRARSIRHLEQLTGENLASFTYAYDPAGNRRVEIERRGGWGKQVVKYSHDARNQLVSATLRRGGKGFRGYEHLAYSWDPAGNRLARIRDGSAEVATFGARNEMLTLEGREFEYDADGNLLQEPIDGKDVRTYAYDCEGNLTTTQLERVSKGKSSTGWIQGKGSEKGKGKGPPEKDPAPPSGVEDKPQFRREYLYSPDGLKTTVLYYPGRSPKVVRREDRFWTGGRLREELSYNPKKGAHSAKHRFYLRTGGVAEEVVGKLDEGVLEARSGEDRFYFKDVLGSTVLTTLENLSGSTAFRYLPFGEQVKGDRKTPFTFTGLRKEHIGGGNRSELYSAQYRHLRPRLGRWTARDPAGQVDGPNLYQYVQNRPLVAVDPSGLGSIVATGPGKAELDRILRKLRTDAVMNSWIEAVEKEFPCTLEVEAHYIADHWLARFGSTSTIPAPLSQSPDDFKRQYPNWDGSSTANGQTSPWTGAQLLPAMGGTLDPSVIASLDPEGSVSSLMRIYEGTRSLKLSLDPSATYSITGSAGETVQGPLLNTFTAAQWREVITVHELIHAFGITEEGAANLIEENYVRRGAYR